MPRSEQQAIKIAGDGLVAAEATMHYTVFEKSDRMKRALIALGLCWLIAAVTVLIPIAHFVLVPGFFIAGPIVATSRYRQSVVKEKVTGKCPKCGNEVSIGLDANDQLPKWTYCPSCDTSIQLKD